MFDEAVECPDHVTYERAKDKDDERESHAENAHSTLRGEGGVGGDPCSNQHGSGVAGAPVVIETGKHGENNCRDKGKLENFSQDSADLGIVNRSGDGLDVHGDADQSENQHNEKQSEILEYLATIDTQ